MLLESELVANFTPDAKKFQTARPQYDHTGYGAPVSKGATRVKITEKSAVLSSGMNTASRDKFPRAILPRTFDFGFATALMYKDVDLCMREAAELGADMPLADAVHEIWRQTNEVYGGANDFTRIAQFVEAKMGVVIKPKQG